MYNQMLSSPTPARERGGREGARVTQDIQESMSYYIRVNRVNSVNSVNHIPILISPLSIGHFQPKTDSAGGIAMPKLAQCVLYFMLLTLTCMHCHKQYCTGEQAYTVSIPYILSLKNIE